MPALVFSNACQSARTNRWNHSVEHSGDASFGLANAFMLAGVRHCIGSSWEIKDEPSRNFACLFYEHLVSGKTVGEAVHQARLDLMKKDQSGSDISWASYVLYGDPTFSYFGQSENEGCIELKVTGIDPAKPAQPRISHDWKKYQKIAAVAGGLLIMSAIFLRYCLIRGTILTDPPQSLLRKICLIQCLKNRNLCRKLVSDLSEIIRLLDQLKESLKKLEGISFKDSATGKEEDIR